MAEALADEIDDPATGLVSRDYLRAGLAELRRELTGEIQSLEARFIRWTVTLFGVQIALVGVLVAILVRLLANP